MLENAINQKLPSSSLKNIDSVCVCVYVCVCEIKKQNQLQITFLAAFIRNNINLHIQH